MEPGRKHLEYLCPLSHSWAAAAHPHVLPVSNHHDHDRPQRLGGKSPGGPALLPGCLGGEGGDRLLLSCVGFPVWPAGIREVMARVLPDTPTGPSAGAATVWADPQKSWRGVPVFQPFLFYCLLTAEPRIITRLSPNTALVAPEKAIISAVPWARVQPVVTCCSVQLVGDTSMTILLHCCPQEMACCLSVVPCRSLRRSLGVIA